MPRDDIIRIEGAVIEVLPNQMVRVEFSNGHRILARTAGKWRFRSNRVLLASRVTVEISPYDFSKGAVFERENEIES